jgi:hypothetical protein
MVGITWATAGYLGASEPMPPGAAWQEIRLKTDVA